ncbi:MAG TPA: hypothetical protein VLA82_02375 [Actinomycetota bacterium]|nr:hypothetical protein [Actinomycetota bacterium]
MGEAEERRYVARAAEHHVVAAQQDVTDAGQLGAVLDQARRRVGVTSPPVARENAGLEESGDAAELHRVAMSRSVGVCTGFGFDPADEAVA